MLRETRRHARTRSLLILVAVVGLLAGERLVAAKAVMDATTECLAEFVGVPDANTNGGSLACSDCDPACDVDGVGTPNRACTFALGVCLDQASGSCAASTIRKVKVIKKSGNCKGVDVRKLRPTPSGSSAVCGTTGLTLATKKKGKKAGKCVIVVAVRSTDKPARTDKDTLTLVCNPQTASSCPTTTTTTTTTPTTTVPSVCGNGTLEPGEACDTPGQQGTCGAGQLCNCSCTACVTPVPCTCGATTPTKLAFTTDGRGGICGSVTPAACVAPTTPPAGNACTSDADCAPAPGKCVGDLACSGLNFGGSKETVPLPARVPDMGTSIMKVAFCTGDGSTMELCFTNNTDTGTHRTCTAGGVADPDYPACVGGTSDGKTCRVDGDCPGGTCTGTIPGCLFGPPLPIPNLSPGNAPTSTCLVNRVARNASGTAQCQTGETFIDLPLFTDIYLTGDLLDGSAPDQPQVVGVQTCPLCTKTCTGGTNGGQPCTSDPDCSGGTCSAQTTCLGGPRHGMTCTPGDSDVPTVCNGGTSVGTPCTVDSDCPGGGLCNHPYPTSHDCPPPGIPLATLSIPFMLTTGTSEKSATDIGPDFQQKVFCGFCARDPSLPAFRRPPTPCTSDADCAPFAPATICKQRDPGAFGQALANHIVKTGSPAGDLTDGLLHDQTLVSVFCVPPSYSAVVDPSADLPGPGAVSLPGKTQLLP